MVARVSATGWKCGMLKSPIPKCRDWRLGIAHIGLREIVSDEQQGQPGQARGGVAHAIAEVERGRMPAFPVAIKGIGRNVEMFAGEADDLDFKFAHELIQK